MSLTTVFAGTYIDRTQTKDKKVCCIKPKLSRFGQPTHVSVSGRAVTAFGLPIRNAGIYLMDESGEIRRTASSGFGIFQFQHVPSGGLYVIFISHGRYMFATPSYIIEVDKDRSDILFWGELIF